ncbi:MAG: YebC/PmpR family DNA-binding transcriptional regulator [Phycisphaerae bacterium]|nr:YebC/PmpR family DNA-binding transcriptional regulator [Phycisphaerae bacterium]
MAGHSAWKNIKHRKAAVDAKRGKIWSKCSRAIIVAARSGGADIKFNASLRLAVDEAKAANMPRDTIEKAIKKGAGGNDADRYEPVRYEGYASGGVAVVVECLVSNVNKTAPEVRTIFDKNFGNLGVPGSVSYSFQQHGVLLVGAHATTEERLFEVALEAGAEDIVGGDEGWQITTAPADLARVRDALESHGIALESAELTYIPATMVEVTDEDAARVARLVAALEEHDDVQKVHINADVGSV